MEHDMSATMEREAVDIAQLTAQWARIRGQLQAEVGEHRISQLAAADDARRKLTAMRSSCCCRRASSATGYEVATAIG